MPKQEGQKSKLLALLRIFEQQTDENHLLNGVQNHFIYLGYLC